MSSTILDPSRKKKLLVEFERFIEELSYEENEAHWEFTVMRHILFCLDHPKMMHLIR
jgi:hypothetical protein